DISEQLDDIMNNVHRIIARYSVDLNLFSGKNISLKEYRKKKKASVLEDIATYANVAEIREKILAYTLAWLEEWNAVLSEATVMDVDEHYHWIAQMEMLPDTLKTIESNVKTLVQFGTSFLEEKERQKKKTLSRGTLWKPWKERITKRPATAHALRPDQMISDEFATNTKVSEIQDMLQELIGTAMFNRLENNVIKYISSTILNLSKALSTVKEELKILNLQCTNMYTDETSTKEKELFLKIIQDFSEENEMLQQKLQDAEEKYEQRIQSKVVSEQALPTSSVLKELSGPSPQLPLAIMKDGGIDSILAKEFENITEEAQRKGTGGSGMMKDSAVSYAAQVEMTSDVTKQQHPLPENKQMRPSEDTSEGIAIDSIPLKKDDGSQGDDQYRSQKRKRRKSSYVRKTFGSNLRDNKGEQKVTEAKSNQYSELPALEKKINGMKSFSEVKSRSSAKSKNQHFPSTELKSQGGKSETSSMWEQLRKFKHELLFDKSPERKEESAIDPRDRESQREMSGQMEPLRKIHLGTSEPQREKIKQKKHQASSKTTTNKEKTQKKEMLDKEVKFHKLKSPSKMAKETSVSTRALESPEIKSEQNNLEEFQKAIMAFLKQKIDNVGKPFDKKTGLKEEESLKRAEMEKLGVIKAKMEEYFQKVAETITKILRKYKVIKKEGQFGKQPMKHKKVVSFMPGLHFQKSSVHTKSESSDFLSQESIDPVTKNLVQMILAEIESERDVPAVSRIEKDHKEKEKQRSEEYLQEGQEEMSGRSLRHQLLEERNLWKESYEKINMNLEEKMSWLQLKTGKQGQQRQLQWQEEEVWKKQQKQEIPKQIEHDKEQDQRRKEEEQWKPKQQWLEARKQTMSKQRMLLEEVKGEMVTQSQKAEKLQALKKGREKEMGEWLSKTKDQGRDREEDLMKMVTQTSMTLSPRRRNNLEDGLGLYQGKESHTNLKTPEDIPDKKKRTPRTPPTSEQSTPPGSFPISGQPLTNYISLIPEQAQDLGTTLIPQQAQDLGIPLIPQQAQAGEITLTPHQAKDLGITLTSQKAQDLGITLIPQQAQARGITLTPQQAQALGISLTPQQAQAQGITLTPQQAQALGISLTTQQTQAQGITLTPQQAQALGISLTPQQLQAQGITLTPQQVQDLGITLTPQQARAQGITLTPQQAQDLGITLTPQQAQDLGITLTPQQAQALGISLTPQQAQAQGITLTPQQSQDLGITLTPQQAQDLGISLTPQQAQAQGITLTPQQAQDLGITLTPQQAQDLGITLTPQQAQALGISLTPQQAQAQGITLTPQQAQALGISLTPQQLQAQGITLTPQQAQALGISLTPQQVQDLGITLTPQQTQAQGITLTPQQAQALGISLTPQQAQAQGITLTPQQAQDLGITLTPQQAQDLGISLTPQQAQAQSLGVPLIPGQAQSLQNQLVPEWAQALMFTLTPKKAQTLSITLTHEQAQAAGITLIPDQTQALGVPLTPDQAQVLEVPLTEEQAWKLGAPTTPEKVQVTPNTITLDQFQALGVTSSLQQAQALGVPLTLEQAQALGVSITPENAWVSAVILSPEQTQALESPITLEQAQALGVSLPQEQFLKSGIPLTLDKASTLQSPLSLEQGQPLSHATSAPSTQRPFQKTQASLSTGQSITSRLPPSLRQPLASSAPMAEKSSVFGVSSTPLPISRPPLRQGPFVAGKSPEMGIQLPAPQIHPSSRKTLVCRGRSTLRQLLAPEVPSTSGQLPISRALPTPEQPLISEVPPTSGQIPSLWAPLFSGQPLVPVVSSIPRELLESEQPQAFQPPAIPGQSPHLQAPFTLGQHQAPWILPGQASPLLIPPTPKHPPTLWTLEGLSSSVARKRLAIISSLKSKPAWVHPGAPDFQVSQVPLKQLRTFQSYLANYRTLGSQTPYSDEGALPTLMKSRTSLPFLTIQPLKTSQISPSEWDQKSRFPPIDRSWIPTSVSGTKKPKMMISPASPQELEEKRYFVDVEAQRKNLILLNQATKTSGLPSQLHTTAKNLIIETLHVDMVRLGYLFRKYIAYRLIQRAR
ncbi:protein FAM186A, partial [Carlito syrichta]|uniref:Protein FAM186A n=1 Tax=Carlito syrichta TaxID=1868482 RepID=A0A1U7TJ56_CARSF